MTSVYLIKAGDTNNYKIDISNDTNSRLNSLQTAHYEKLSIVHEKAYINRFIALIIEEELHYEYKDFNTLGEWFSLDNNQVQEVIETLNQEVTENLLLRARIKELEKEIKRVSLQRKGYNEEEPQRKVGFAIFLNDEDYITALYSNGIIKEGNKLIPKSRVMINPNSRREDEKIRAIYNKLLENNIIEYKPSQGYYAKADYEAALSVIGDA